MMSRRRNPLNLSIPTSTVHEVDQQRVESEMELSTFPMEEQLMQMALTEPQKRRMQEWIKEKNLVNFCFFFLLISRN